MGQSLNLYIAAPNGRKLHEMYTYTWEAGLKTTYYLRSVAANTIEKTTLQSRPRWAREVKTDELETSQELSACSLEAKMRGEECEACQ
jgi:ribonucleoside-diphosphate reductase alpha chain